jgi:hypothetical protein
MIFLNLFYFFLFVGEEGGKSFNTESDPRSKAND